MIRRLRARHRAAFVALALLLPAGFALGLAARRPAPAMHAVPGAGAPAVPAAAEWRSLPGASPEGAGVAARLLAGAEGGDVLELRPSEDLQRPDVLVYLSAAAGPFDALPEDAVLLGTLAGAQTRRFTLPPVAGARPAARLVLYSLAHAAVVAEAELPAAEGR